MFLVALDYQQKLWGGRVQLRDKTAHTLSRISPRDTRLRANHNTIACGSYSKATVPGRQLNRRHKMQPQTISVRDHWSLEQSLATRHHTHTDRQTDRQWERFDSLLDSRLSWSSPCQGRLHPNQRKGGSDSYNQWWTIFTKHPAYCLQGMLQYMQTDTAAVSLDTNRLLTHSC